MVKIDIISGFLGAGKTTLIKKFIGEAFQGEKLVLIENEFGEIGVDGGFLKDAGIEIKEMNSGCICCSLVGDFAVALQEVIDTYQPERIIIEPSGVGKLSDVESSIVGIDTTQEIVVNNKIAVVNAKKCKMYAKNFGEFFINQVEHADAIVLSRTLEMGKEELDVAIELLRTYNDSATIVTTPWDQLEGKQMLEAIEHQNQLEESLLSAHEHDHHECHGHDHDHHDHGHDGCGCGCCGGHDEHEHGHHHHHGHHHADEVFTSWGIETANKYDANTFTQLLEELNKEEEYGIILRAKGMLESEDGTWIYFDYVPGETEVRTGIACTTGKICVIGSNINEVNIKKLFQV